MNVIDQDLNQVMRYFRELKSNLFEFMFLILKDDNSNFPFICLIAVIQFFQSLFYFFYAEVKSKRSIYLKYFF